MDIISFSKANKAKKAIKTLQNRLGMDGTEQDSPVDYVDGLDKTVKERLEKLEENGTDHLINLVSDMEANLNVNLNKHNLNVNSILMKDKYNLTDLAFDDFADDDGIDATLSSNQVFDQNNKLFKIRDNETKAEVVTTAEVVNSDPTMIAVSIATNQVDTLKTKMPTVFASRDNGVTWKEIPLDVLTDISDQPSGNQLRIKVVLENGQELQALSYSWI